MPERIGETSGEGGPFLIADRIYAEQWRGASDGSLDYEQVFGLGPAGGHVRVGTGGGVAWDPAGGATVDLFRLAPDRFLLQREWAADAGVMDMVAGAEVIGDLTVVTGSLVVVWSPFAWEDVRDPPPPGEEGKLSTGGMIGIGLQALARSGDYSCAVLYSDDAYRCWISRQA